MAEGYGISSGVARKKGDLESSLALGRRAHEIFQGLKSADLNNRLAGENVVFTALRIGEILVLQGKITEGGALGLC